MQFIRCDIEFQCSKLSWLLSKFLSQFFFSPGSHSEVMFITNSNNISKIEAKNLFGSKLFMTHWHTHTRTTQTPIELHSKRNESNRSIRNFTIQWQIDCTQNNFDVYTAPCQQFRVFFAWFEHSIENFYLTKIEWSPNAKYTYTLYSLTFSRSLYR